MELFYVIFCILFIAGKYESAPVSSNAKGSSPSLTAVGKNKFNYFVKKISYYYETFIEIDGYVSIIPWTISYS